MLRTFLPLTFVRLAALSWMLSVCGMNAVYAAVTEFNSTGGTTATNGLHFYIEDTTKIQVRRLNNTGQVYEPSTLPPSTNLDNGIFLRANGLIYGPDHNVATFTPTGGMYSSYAITAASPANPSSSGIQPVSYTHLDVYKRQGQRWCSTGQPYTQWRKPLQQH